MFKRSVNNYIAEKSLFGMDDKILVALSGGADSVALLRVLLSSGYSCVCAHCNFHLRGDESNRDEDFVRHLCESLSVPLHVVHFETEAYASRHHLSIEMAARTLRYEWFEQVRQECGAAVIAVAHHRDDSVETFLLNLIRGTGINGLKGIAPKNGFVVRPLLQTGREDILEYLKHIRQDFVTDSTNLQDEYMRNKVRLNILPLMRELNPSANESILQTSMRLAEAALVYHKERAEAMERVSQKRGDTLFISITALQAEVSPSSLLFELLYPYGFNPSQISDIFQCLHKQSGKCFSTDTHRLLRDRDQLIMEPVAGHSDDIPPQLTYEIVEITPQFTIPKDKHVACLDADKVTLPFTVRKWRHGDKFRPLGMAGKKCISDYLTDRKFTLFQKERQYVVCDGGTVIWLIGERIDHSYRITAESKRAIIISCDK